MQFSLIAMSILVIRIQFSTNLAMFYDIARNAIPATPARFMGRF